VGWQRRVGTAAMTGRPLTRWDWRDGDIVADSDELHVRYLARVPPIGWSPGFAALVRYALAAELAMPLTESRTRADYWQRQAYGLPSEARRGGQFRAATASDAQSAPSVVIADFPIHDVRHGHGRHGDGRW
jgi:hypothetical protein